LIEHLLIVALLIGLAVPTVLARGRKPADQDNYPDYNRLEFRKKAPEPPAEPPAPSPISPSLSSPPNSPSKTPSEMDAPPKPPPAAVPVPSDNSEPTLPDDMMKTLVPGTTGQK